MTEALVAALREAVGPTWVLTRPAAQRRFLRGYRVGGGPALAVVRPGGLVAYWDALKACVNHGAAVILQAANTGLTGGSTPFGTDYGRPVVVISTMRMAGLHLIDSGRQVVALPGATLDALEVALQPLGREPHSVIGSSCLGASVVGGVCNNSGGSLVKRGPSYTELALYAQLGEDGRLRLVNDLGIELGGAEAEILTAVEQGCFGTIRPGVGADPEYQTHVRDIQAATPARFNADPRKLYGASGSAGKIAVFAVRLDTFEAEVGARVFYVGSNRPEVLTGLRQRMLSEAHELPIAAEYIHRETFDIAASHGKDTFLAVRHLGTRRLPRLFAAKSRVDALTERFGMPAGISDRLLQAVAKFFPQHLPRRIRDFRRRFEHHLLLKVSGSAVAETEHFLNEACVGQNAAAFLCDAKEASAAFLHRFAAAGAAIRMATLRPSIGLVALDIALPRNCRDWVEVLPADLAGKIRHRLYYGHFFCHVFHQDYLLEPGVDADEVKHKLLELFAARGAKYPAEHNFGHLYPAPNEVLSHYRDLDPCNSFNPGIGLTTQHAHWHTSHSQT